MRAILLMCAAVAAAAPLAAVTVIADPTMAAGDYSGGLTYITFGGGITSISHANFTTGGNGGDYRQTSFTVGPPPGSGVQALGEFNVTHLYNPAVQGAANTVAYSIDAMTPLVPTGQPPVSLLFGLRQGNISYFNLVYGTLGGGWQTVQRNGLVQGSFVPLTGGPPAPDFSASGSPIEFGYFVSAYSLSPTGGNYQLNTDNFCVVVNGASSDCPAALAAAEAPEPATMAMFGVALLGLGSARKWCRRRWA